jgi:DNA-binding PadR family transcriptional regulator
MMEDTDDCRNHSRGAGRSGFRGLRTLALELIAEEPRKGSEIIKIMEDRTNGWWKPSPGSVYPLLSDLENSGFIKKLESGKYELTEQGRNELSIRRGAMRGFSFGQRPLTVSDMLSEMESYVRYFEDLGEDLKPDFSRLQELEKRIRKILDMN